MHTMDVVYLFSNRCFDFRSICLTNIGTSKTPDPTQLNMSLVPPDDPLHHSAYVLIDNNCPENDSNYKNGNAEHNGEYVSNFACLRDEFNERAEKGIDFYSRRRAVWYSKVAEKRERVDTAGCKFCLVNFEILHTVEPR